MANLPRYVPRSLSLGPPPSQRFSPFKEIGASGVAIFGGRPMTREKDVRVTGPQRYITYGDLVTNTSIVAAGVRYFLNILAHAKWTVQPAEESAEGEKAAEFIDGVINGMTTPWRRVMRRAGMYRFHGFGVQEWTAKRNDEGKIGLDDVEARPQHTIDRWEVDEQGTVQGVWQLSPQTSRWLYLPRGKILYLVEDSISDSPEGLGLFRHLVKPYETLNAYMVLEGRGFERDLRGIPIGRVPYQALKAAVKGGAMTQAEADANISALESFVKIQVKQADSSIVLDSAPYVVETDSGKSISGIMQFGLELLQGQTPAFGELSTAIERLNREMARVIGVEHLLLGESGSANRSLAEDKSRNFYLTVNSSLSEIADASNRDIIATVCDLNGIDKKLRPKLKHSDVSFRAVGEVTGALAQMATAGAVLTPDDPAIDDVREMLGISKPPDLTPERMALLMPPPPVDPNAPPGTQSKPGFPPKPGAKQPPGKPGFPPKPGAKPKPSAARTTPETPSADSKILAGAKGAKGTQVKPGSKGPPGTKGTKGR